MPENTHCLDSLKTTKMLEITDLNNLHNSDLHYPNQNGDFLRKQMEQTDGSTLPRNNTVPLQTPELNSVQALLHEGETLCMLNEYGDRTYTDRNGIHVEGRLYRCELCEYSTAYMYCLGLKTHKLIHTGEKPYKCDLCDYSTTTSRNLRRHTLVHTGEKPYKCNLCTYSCAQYSVLTRH